jgi:hypothetical protein
VIYNGNIRGQYNTRTTDLQEREGFLEDNHVDQEAVENSNIPQQSHKRRFCMLSRVHPEEHSGAICNAS